MTRCIFAVLFAGLLLVDRPAAVMAQEFRDLFNGRAYDTFLNRRRTRPAPSPTLNSANDVGSGTAVGAVGAV
jgi:hypothetical protein